MTIDTEKLRVIAGQATGGPWRQVTNKTWGDSGYVRAPGPAFGEKAISVAYASYSNPGCSHESASRNAEYIATFDPPTVLELLAEVEQLRAALDLACAWGDYPLDECLEDADAGLASRKP